MLRKKETKSPGAEQMKTEKPIPTFMREDYPYKAVDEVIEDPDSLEPTMIYEIKCNECEMAIRSQGINIKKTYARLKDSGCIGCGSKNLIVKRVYMRIASREENRNNH